jgi:hypothetical protein
MKIELKLSQALYDTIRSDLQRSHPFAAERVGFVMARTGALSQGGVLILPTRYHSIPDDQYLRDSTVGARIGPEAMRSAMEAVYHGRSNREGIFHVHLHPHSGETAMSRTDSRELPPLIPGFQSVGPLAAHGILILSRNHGTAWVWLPGQSTAQVNKTISIIGTPLELFIQGKK